MAETVVPATKTHRVFYGYWVVASAFAILFISAGCGFYPFSLFVKPLQDEFGWGRAQIMMASLTWTITHGIGSFLVGRFMDRYGPRKVIVIGVFISGLGIALLASLKNLWQLYIFYSISGLGFPASGPIPISTLIFSWFKRKRGLAIGLTGMGVGAGGFVMSLIIGTFLIPGIGWRTTYLLLGLLMAGIIIPLALFVLRTRPGDMGLLPDGDAAAPLEANPKAKLGQPLGGLHLGEAFKTQAFWCIAVASAAMGFSVMGVNRNQVPHLQDIGFSSAAAASVLGLVGVGNGLGKFFFGVISDWIEPKHSFVIALALQIIALAILMAVRPSTTPTAALWVYALMSGFGTGSWLPIMAMLTTTNFGPLAYGSIFGMINLINLIGGATGPLVAGYIYDAQNSYRLAFIFFLLVFVIAIAAASLIRRPEVAKNFSGVAGRPPH